MTPSRVALALVLVIVMVLLAAGCAGPVREPQASPEHIGTHAGNGSHWLKIDPVGKHLVGDIFPVTGITNLPAGTEVRCEFASANMPVKNSRYENMTILVTNGDDGLNRTVVPINSSELIPDNYSSGEFTIIERAVGNTAKDVAPFRLDRIRYEIHLDAISNKQFGDKFTVIGTTSLPAGNDVDVRVRSKFYDSSTIGKTMVMSGSGGLNITSFMVDTSDLRPAEYDTYYISETYDHGGISASGFMEFSISDIPAGPYFISIGPYTMFSPAGTQTFRSTTNLSAGDEVFWEFRTIPAPGSILLNGTTTVTNGDEGFNQTAVAINDSIFGNYGNFVLTEKAVTKEGGGYDLFFVVPVP